ncbi:hypothetical protein SAM23877_1735 [Streptomyces ambofaciens ATCC 23877]|uniref:Uncharacterized protein n=1 Tax=Streptomyces ambofaciens (strain ATCC 23877 / 3486 / DSM 40053 / JCM 4204 / NBRC 12836 / NRRL B-2516) TaxID=278992 RepID=A0A0K2AP76_STRA7|nr:hypothetical protein SAM23877_1735 [Streptomyces ambofaciens ATCC 23877]
MIGHPGKPGNVYVVAKGKTPRDRHLVRVAEWQTR